jgi:histidine triad (HIT) family protein
MAECIFCKIASGDLESTIVHQDDMVVAFRDINPQAPTHIVLIPRKHVPSLDDLGHDDDRMVAHLVRTASQLAHNENIAQSGYRLVSNCGPAAGQSVEHLHFHLLGGRSLTWPPG